MLIVHAERSMPTGVRAGPSAPLVQLRCRAACEKAEAAAVEPQVKHYVHCAKHKQRCFTSFHTLKYHARTVAGIPVLLRVVQTFCSTAARDDPRGLHVSIKGDVLQQLDRDAAVAYATALLDILATRPDLHTLRLSLPPHPATIARLAHLPGLRHLTLHLFHPKPAPGTENGTDIDLAAEDCRQELVGAVLGATRQVTHLTLEDSEMHRHREGDTPIPPQLQQCTQLQVFSSKTLSLVVWEPEQWGYVAGAVQLRDASLAVAFRKVPPAGVTLPGTTEAILIPNHLEDLRAMLAALPALESARVYLNDYIDPSYDSNQVFTSNTLRKMDAELWGTPDVEVACCEALLAASFPQLRHMRLRFGALGWPRAARGGLSGFPHLTKLTISTAGWEQGNFLMDYLHPIITSAQTIEELEMWLDVYNIVDHTRLVDLICGMPCLRKLTCNGEMLGDYQALKQAVRAAGSAVRLVSSDIVEAFRSYMHVYGGWFQEPWEQPSSSGEEDEYEEEEEEEEVEDDYEDEEEEYDEEEEELEEVEGWQGQPPPQDAEEGGEPAPKRCRVAQPML